VTRSQRVYRRVPIDPGLQPFVLEIRIEEPAGARAEPRSYNVLPGPYPVIGFRLAGELRVVRATGSELFSPTGITGLQDGARRYHAEPRTRSALVVLRPEGAFGLFGVSMDELVNRETALDSLLPAALVREVEERVAATADPEEVGSVIGSFLRGACSRSRVFSHPVVTATVKRILESHGNARVEALARELAIGRRQLERLFRLHVGMSPKRLSQIARFSWAATHLQATRPLSRLALSAGYSDQAHFVRSFTAFAGAPPTRLLASGEASEMSHSFNT
jgi:AraC-like DNA-binding protein